MSTYFTIGNRHIGNDYPPLVIAEIGINHGGNLSVAKEMVDAAYKAGAEIIKHQTHVIDDEMTESAKKVIPGNAKDSIYHIMERSALNEKDEFELKQYVEEKGMIFLSTPFSREAANRLEKMDVLAYKIGSGECNNYPLIEHVASFRKPMIVSTGMNTIISIKKTVQILEEYKVPYALLHCTNLYPTPPELVRLGGFQELQKQFPNTVIGLSDHTVNNNAAIAATALGASILERHFTDSYDRNGPDIECSMDPQALKSLIKDSKEVARMRGGTKEPAKEEKVTMDFAFSTVVTTKNIKKGDRFTKDNVWVKRPGIGEIYAEDYNNILGKIATQDLNSGYHLNWNNVSSK
ncbi:N-acetylneuraminate synthase family protein [Gracilibacillus suaedae]|uniref:N-acetylneuraminate synthase family protein n=1 Tax=Gracilibacillus suaedae TaxID=2820273 RepID=UPI001E5B63BD|nr:N-acetylneuraminate synthase family protein [Gracilibacillus suaedae]